MLVFKGEEPGALVFELEGNSKIQEDFEIDILNTHYYFKIDLSHFNENTSWERNLFHIGFSNHGDGYVRFFSYGKARTFYLNNSNLLTEDIINRVVDIINKHLFHSSIELEEERTFF